VTSGNGGGGNGGGGNGGGGNGGGEVGNGSVFCFDGGSFGNRVFFSVVVNRMCSCGFNMLIYKNSLWYVITLYAKTIAVIRTIVAMNRVNETIEGGG
jgi:hypothetical protein